MGVDTGNVERTDPWAGNSDSMILVTVNPKTKKVVMMSLERDILTQIQQPDGSVREAKLNAAYADGGAELAISTIQKNDEYPYRPLCDGQYARSSKNG